MFDIGKWSVCLTLVLGSWCCLVRFSAAYKDDSYYIAGTSNPNVNERMYWKDTDNILQDLKKFSSLYVEFHQCAWTVMQTADADNDVEENDYWYMGKMPTMGANVAFSLYGSLQGDTFAGCGKSTFINSFYTNTGFTNFAQAMKYAGVQGFSSYSYGNSYLSSTSLTATCQAGYGVGCDTSHGFAVHTYGTDECNPPNMTGVTNGLYNLNQAMKKAKCVQIYSSKKYSGYYSGTPLELLYNSHSCFYQDVFSPDGECPDPYGILSYYRDQFHAGIQEYKRRDPYVFQQYYTKYGDQMEKGQIMVVAGAAMLGLAGCMLMIGNGCLVDRRRKARRAQRKSAFRLRRGAHRPHGLDAVEEHDYEAQLDDDGFLPPINKMDRGDAVTSIATESEHGDDVFYALSNDDFDENSQVLPTNVRVGGVGVQQQFDYQAPGFDGSMRWDQSSPSRVIENMDPSGRYTIEQRNIQRDMAVSPTPSALSVGRVQITTDNIVGDTDVSVISGPPRPEETTSSKLEIRSISSPRSFGRVHISTDNVLGNTDVSVVASVPKEEEEEVEANDADLQAGIQKAESAASVVSEQGVPTASAISVGRLEISTDQGHGNTDVSVVSVPLEPEEKEKEEEHVETTTGPVQHEKDTDSVVSEQVGAERTLEQASSLLSYGRIQISTDHILGNTDVSVVSVPHEEEVEEPEMETDAPVVPSAASTIDDAPAQSAATVSSTTLDGVDKVSASSHRSDDDDDDDDKRGVAAMVSNKIPDEQEDEQEKEESTTSAAAAADAAESHKETGEEDDADDEILSKAYEEIAHEVSALQSIQTPTAGSPALDDVDMYVSISKAEGSKEEIAADAVESHKETGEDDDDDEILSKAYEEIAHEVSAFQSIQTPTVGSPAPEDVDISISKAEGSKEELAADAVESYRATGEEDDDDEILSEAYEEIAHEVSTFQAIRTATVGSPAPEDVDMYVSISKTEESKEEPAAVAPESHRASGGENDDDEILSQAYKELVHEASALQARRIDPAGLPASEDIDMYVSISKSTEVSMSKVYDDLEDAPFALDARVPDAEQPMALDDEHDDEISVSKAYEDALIDTISQQTHEEQTALEAQQQPLLQVDEHHETFPLSVDELVPPTAQDVVNDEDIQASLSKGTEASMSKAYQDVDEESLSKPFIDKSKACEQKTPTVTGELQGENSTFSPVSDPEPSSITVAEQQEQSALDTIVDQLQQSSAPELEISTSEESDDVEVSVAENRQGSGLVEEDADAVEDDTAENGDEIDDHDIISMVDTDASHHSNRGPDDSSGSAFTYDLVSDPLSDHNGNVEVPVVQINNDDEISEVEDDASAMSSISKVEHDDAVQRTEDQV